jgi:transposase
MEDRAMAKELLPDALWLRIAPLIPPEAPKPKGGRPRVSDRAALTGILFVLKTGIPWEYLPAETTGTFAWRRLSQERVRSTHPAVAAQFPNQSKGITINID